LGPSAPSRELLSRSTGPESSTGPGSHSEWQWPSRHAFALPRALSGSCDSALWSSGAPPALRPASPSHRGHRPFDYAQGKHMSAGGITHGLCGVVLSQAVSSQIGMLEATLTPPISSRQRKPRCSAVVRDQVQTRDRSRNPGERGRVP